MISGLGRVGVWGGWGIGEGGEGQLQRNHLLEIRRYNHLGLSYTMMKKFDLARTNFSSAIDLQDDNPKSHQIGSAFFSP